MAERGVAVIVAHPDDEVLLAGGAIANHADAGESVRVLILSTGATARPGDQDAMVERLRRQALEAGKILGASSVKFGEFPDNRMDTVALLDIVRAVEGFLSEAPSDLVYTHHSGDLNIDHRIVHQAVVTAVRPLPGQTVAEILAGETNSATEWAGPGFVSFQPTDFFDIGATLERKVRALECYESELRQWPHPRSADGVRALARWRGCQVGIDAAEAFMQVRRIRRRP